jgi:GTPase
VDKLYPLINSLFEKTTTKVATARINRVLADAVEAHTPPLVRNKAMKFYYITQTGTVPPRFQIVSNRPDSVPDAYVRYLEHTIKKACGMEGISIKLMFTGRGKEKETD